jgi:hypothetical protein
MTRKTEEGRKCGKILFWGRREEHPIMVERMSTGKAFCA